MNKKPKLEVEKRTIVGKKVKKLRNEGILPANIYGKEIKSLAVQVKQDVFDAIFKEVGETGLVDVSVEGEIRPSLIHNVQRDYLTQLPIHADFFQVNLKEKVKTMVPLIVVGEPKAVTEKIGILLQPASEVEVEALPADLPENIEVHVENLEAVDQQITVADLKAPNGVTVLTDPSQVVAKISELVSKEAAEQAAADAAAQEAAKAETEASTEATPADGSEAKPEEQKMQTKEEVKAVPPAAAKEESK